MRQQSIVADFVTRHNLAKSPPFAALDLVSEVGEVAKAILSASAYGLVEPDWTGAEFSPEAKAQLVEEIGDALYSLYDLANSVGVDADAALTAAIAKYATRWAARGQVSST